MVHRSRRRRQRWPHRRAPASGRSGRVQQIASSKYLPPLFDPSRAYDSGARGGRDAWIFVLSSGYAVGDAGAAHREELPGAGNALEFVRAAIDEVDAGPGDEVPDRLRDENLVGTGVAGDAGANVDGQARDLGFVELSL